MTDSERRSRILVATSTLSAGALAAYLLIVLFLGEALGGALLLTVLALFVAAASSLLGWLLHRRWISRDTLMHITVTAGVTLVCLLAADVAGTVYFALNTPAEELHERILDENSKAGEWYPRVYYPTDSNFQLQKPNLELTGEHYGMMYQPRLMASPTLAKSVFQKQRVSVRINEMGFRERDALEKCGVFVVGDSFAFGWGVSDEHAWPEVLERSLGSPVCNLGVHGASPRQEYLLLKHMLEQRGARMPARHLLWLIYEGNDLEDSYEDVRPRNDGTTVGRVLRGTVIGSIHDVLMTIKHQSWIHKVRSGEVTLAGPRTRGASGAFNIDGVQLAHPLYHSSRHGYLFVYKPLVDIASQPAAYVANHPNRPMLDRTFEEMAALSHKFDFKVTVAIAPTVVRLYAPYFDSTPAQVTKVPHLIEYVKDLSRRNGFEAIDLLTSMEPYASRELLYFRDDDHWNERGNAVAAEILARHLQGSQVAADGGRRLQ